MLDVFFSLKRWQYTLVRKHQLNAHVGDSQFLFVCISFDDDAVVQMAFYFNKKTSSTWVCCCVFLRHLHAYKRVEFQLHLLNLFVAKFLYFWLWYKCWRPNCTRWHFARVVTKRCSDFNLAVEAVKMKIDNRLLVHPISLWYSFENIYFLTIHTHWRYAHGDIFNNKKGNIFVYDFWKQWMKER